MKETLLYEHLDHNQTVIGKKVLSACLAPSCSSVCQRLVLHYHFRPEAKK